MFVRNCWYVAAWSWDLPAEGLLARTILDEPLVLYRNQAGSPVALADRCCHRQALLSLGFREGDHLRCAYHGLKFAPDGACVEIPGQDKVPRRARVRSYPVIERHSWIWVWMGDPARADAALIPAAVGFDDPAWVLRGGTIDYEASYLLINDNLCDFSHLTYVHATSFGAVGGANSAFAHTYPTITPLERGLRIERWTEDAGVADNWITYDYLLPGVLLLKDLTFPPGTAKKSAYKGPTIAPLSATISSQAVTPTTDRTTRYYFSTGPTAPEPSPGVADEMMAVTEAAFAEDKRMIETQQRNWKDGERMVGIQHDRGPGMMRALIARLSREERPLGTEEIGRSPMGAEE